jgi:hypothetical protein
LRESELVRAQSIAPSRALTRRRRTSSNNKQTNFFQ